MVRGRRLRLVDDFCCEAVLIVGCLFYVELKPAHISLFNYLTILEITNTAEKNGTKLSSRVPQFSVYLSSFFLSTSDNTLHVSSPSFWNRSLSSCKLLSSPKVVSFESLSPAWGLVPEQCAASHSRSDNCSGRPGNIPEAFAFSKGYLRASRSVLIACQGFLKYFQRNNRWHTTATA